MKKIVHLFICSLVLITPIKAQVQVTSFDRIGTDLGSYPTGFKIIDDKVIFRAQNSSYGSELWVSSGEPNSATLLKDIFPGRQSGVLSFTFESPAVELNNELYFIANDNLSAGEIWKTDGTTSGTERVTYWLDFNSIQLTLVEDQIYFTIYRNGFIEVWKTNGTSAGTKLVKKNIPALSKAIQGKAGNTFVFSFRQTGSSDVEVWRSDGTADGTYLLLGGIDGNGSGNSGTIGLSQFFNYHDELYFVTRNHIYRTDGTINNTVPVFEYNSSGTTFDYGDVIEANDLLYFSFFKARKQFIVETDGTTAGSDTVYNRTTNYYFIPSNLSSWNDELIFTGHDASNGTSLLKMNLTNYSISEVKQMEDQATMPFIFTERDLTRIVHNDTGLFILMVPNENLESVTWFSDLTEEGTFILPELHGARTAISFRNYFYLPYTISNLNIELGKSGGTDSNTILLDNINPFHFGIGNTRMIGLNDQLIFNAHDGINGDELWTYKHDSITLLKDVRSGIASSFPREFAKVNDRLLFSANDGINGTELWVTDGTTDSTKMLADLNPGPTSSSPFSMTLFKDQLFFAAEISDSVYIMVTDGTIVDTIVNLGVNQFGNPFKPEEWVAGDNLMYFITTESGEEIWVSDGTAAGTFPLMKFGTCNQLTVVHDRAYFTANGPDIYELEVWTSDGTIEGTRLVEDLGIGYSSEPQDLIAYKDWLVFSAKTDFEGREMFRATGTGAGQIMDFNPGGGNTIYHANFAEYKGLLFFNGRYGGTGSELYSSPANNPYPELIKDIRPGAASSFPSELTAIYTNLYFQAYTDENGMELWVTDGTEAGTKLAADILPGQLSSTPTDMIGVGTNVFFIAETQTEGRQIWKLEYEIIESVSDNSPENKILLFPQPAVDHVTIKSQDDVTAVDVYDLNGKWISHKKAISNTISTADLLPGMYILRFNLEDRGVMKQLVKVD